MHKIEKVIEREWERSWVSEREWERKSSKQVVEREWVAGWMRSKVLPHLTNPQRVFCSTTRPNLCFGTERRILGRSMSVWSEWVDEWAVSVRREWVSVHQWVSEWLSKWVSESEWECESEWEWVSVSESEWEWEGERSEWVWVSVSEYEWVWVSMSERV